MENSSSSFDSLEVQPFKSNIAKDIIVTILTCGLYNLFWQYRQMKFINLIAGEEKFSFLKWFIFLILTCGLYNFYHEYLMGCEIVILQEKCGVSRSEGLPAISIVLCVIALGIITDAIQQKEINMIIDKISKS